MSIGIYKIENLINGKIYIGQSIHIQKRWLEHCKLSANSLISDAIKKYGKENFSFQIIKECAQEELTKFESFYIQYYNSLIPYGYNIILEDTQHPSSFNKYNAEEFKQIINDIKNSSLSFKEIADKYSLDLSMIYYLNRGSYHHLKNESYPLRPVLDFSKQHNYCIDCGKEINLYSKRCPECMHISQRKVQRPSREQLKQLIKKFSFVEIANKYNVTDNTIRKWCKAMNLPYQKRQINKFSPQQWKQI